MIQDMDDDLLKRKIRLCEELLLIADVLEPGLSRLRGRYCDSRTIYQYQITQRDIHISGLLLYELHAPIMVSLERKKKTRNTSSTVLKHSLKRVISCLEEAYDVLKYEGETTMEGQIGRAAEQALLATNQWKKELGLGRS